MHLRLRQRLVWLRRRLRRWRMCPVEAPSHLLPPPPACGRARCCVTVLRFQAVCTCVCVGKLGQGGLTRRAGCAPRPASPLRVPLPVQPRPTLQIALTSCVVNPCLAALVGVTQSTARFLSANAPGRVRTVVARLVREGVALNRQPAATPCPWRPFSDRARRCPGVDDFPGRSAASKHSALGRSVKFCKFHVRSLFVSRERERGVDRTTGRV